MSPIWIKGWLIAPSLGGNEFAGADVDGEDLARDRCTHCQAFDFGA